MSVTAIVRVRKPRTRGSAPHSPTLMTTEAGSLALPEGRSWAASLQTSSDGTVRWDGMWGWGEGARHAALGDTRPPC